MYKEIKIQDIEWRTYKGESGDLEILLYGKYNNVELCNLCDDSKYGIHCGKVRITNIFNKYTPESIDDKHKSIINKLLKIVYKLDEECEEICKLCSHNTCDCPFIDNIEFQKKHANDSKAYCMKKVKENLLKK